MQIAIDLPNDFVRFQTATDLSQEIRASYALWLYQNERVTLAKAAEVAGLNLYDFMIVCKSNKTPVIDVSREELVAEIDGFRPV